MGDHFKKQRVLVLIYFVFISSCLFLELSQANWGKWLTQGLKFFASEEDRLLEEGGTPVRPRKTRAYVDTVQKCSPWLFKDELLSISMGPSSYPVEGFFFNKKEM
ncbi:hypothetical protein H1C71_013557, partial [Ictidomys tridecemlineatus]